MKLGGVPELSATLYLYLGRYESLSSKYPGYHLLGEFLSELSFCYQFFAGEFLSELSFCYQFFAGSSFVLMTSVLV